MAEVDVSTTVYNLEIETELRILVGEQSTNVSIELVSGLAEIYGTEMVINKIYTFKPMVSIAIYTWEGCSVKVTGKPEDAYISSDSKAILPSLLHASLETKRKTAKQQNTRGPVILVVGPTDMGKTTLCHLLLNYASRRGWKPVFIDLDVGENSISIPGTLGLLIIEKPADIATGFDTHGEKYHFGHNSPRHNIALYFLLLKELAKRLSCVEQENGNAKSSGVIINSCGWVDGQGYDAIVLAARSFKIDILCVLEEDLYVQLKHDVPPSVKVMYFPKMDGALKRSQTIRTQILDAQVRQFFYSPINKVYLRDVEILYSEMHIFKVLPKSLAKNVDTRNVALSDIDIIPVPLSMHLKNQVLSVSSTSRVTSNMVLTSVYGFVCIKDVDMDDGTVILLSPYPGPIPSKILFIGDIRFK